jgi:tRNA(Ile)-lysidine synthase
METFLLRLMRGSGLAGLTSMREVSDFPHAAGQQKQLKLARPLLSITKQNIIDFAQQHKLTWVNDESNTDDKFDRNFVRLSILPQLFKRWPAAGKSINTSTALLQQDFDLLNEYVEQD